MQNVIVILPRQQRSIGKCSAVSRERLHSVCLFFLDEKVPHHPIAMNERWIMVLVVPTMIYIASVVNIDLPRHLHWLHCRCVVIRTAKAIEQMTTASVLNDTRR